jgi:hypothetical protein
MRDVYVMQHALVTTALAVAITRYSVFVVICTQALCSFCLCVFGRPDLSPANGFVLLYKDEDM